MVLGDDLCRVNGSGPAFEWTFSNEWCLVDGLPEWFQVDGRMDRLGANGFDWMVFGRMCGLGGWLRPDGFGRTVGLRWVTFNRRVCLDGFR